MKCIASSIAVLLALCLVTTVKAQSLQSTFDTGAEGWTTNTGGVFVHLISGGNPGGYLSISDTSNEPNYGVVAPEKFLGDISAFNGGNLSFDTKIFETGTNSFDPTVGLVIITSPSGTATLDVIPDVPPRTWKTYSTLLTSSAWGKSSSEWAAILSNVTRIEIQIEAYTGPDVTGFDNFRLYSVPEPGTLPLLTSISISSLFTFRLLRRPKK